MYKNAAGPCLYHIYTALYYQGINRRRGVSVSCFNVPNGPLKLIVELKFLPCPALSQYVLQPTASSTRLFLPSLLSLAGPVFVLNEAIAGPLEGYVN